MSETIDVKDIKYTQARDINWGEDFNALEDKQKVIYLKKFSASMNQAAELIQIERNQLLIDNETMKRMLAAGEMANTTHKATLMKVISDNNASSIAAGKEIAELKRQLRGA